MHVLENSEGWVISIATYPIPILSEDWERVGPTEFRSRDTEGERIAWDQDEKQWVLTSQPVKEKQE